TDDEEKNLKRLSDLEEGLHRKRLISYGGLLKLYYKFNFATEPFDIYTMNKTTEIIKE
ncbi:replication protein, partial [Staphylococcus aureus VET1048S]